MSDLMPGLYENVRIVDHVFKVVGDKKTPLLELACEIDDASGTHDVRVNIWMSRKALPMARRALKLCGFDPDVHDLGDLQRNSRLLAGCVIPQVDVEVNQYGPTGTIPLRQRVDEDLLAKMTEAIRQVKQQDEPEVQKPQRQAVPNDPMAGYDDSDIPF